MYNDKLKIHKTRAAIIQHHHPKNAIFITPFAELTSPPPFPKTTNPLSRWKDPHKDYLHSDSTSNRMVPLLYACILSATTCCWSRLRIRLRWPWTQHHNPFATRYRWLWTEIEISTKETYNFYYQTMTRLVMQGGTHHLLLWHAFTYLYYTKRGTIMVVLKHNISIHTKLVICKPIIVQATLKSLSEKISRSRSNVHHHN